MVYVISLRANMPFFVLKDYTMNEIACIAISINNLLITSEYGAAQCLGMVLTDAPLDTTLCEPLLPKCGKCNICMNICEKKVLKGKMWSAVISILPALHNFAKHCI